MAVGGRRGEPVAPAASMQAFLLFLALVAASCASPSTRTQSEYHSATVSIVILIKGEVDIGAVALKNRDFPAAEAAFRRAMQIHDSDPARLRGPVGPILTALGVALKGQAKYLEAKDILMRALRATEHELGSHHEAVADVAVLLGGVFSRLADLSGARFQYERALAIKERHLGPDHPDHVPLLILVGTSLRLEGNFPRSHELLERALRIVDADGTRDSEATAILLAELAHTVLARGDWDSAQLLYQRRLNALERRSHRSDDLRLGIALLDLAEVMLLQGDGSTAYQLALRALPIYAHEVQRGPGSPPLFIQVARLNRVVGLARGAAGDLEQARTFLEMSLDLFRKANSPAANSDRAITLYHLARIYALQGQYDNAALLYEETTRTLETTTGRDQWNVVASLYGRAKVRWLQGRLGDASSLVRQAKEIEERIFSHALNGLSQRQRIAAVNIGRVAGLDFFFSLPESALATVEPYRSVVLWKNSVFHAGRTERPPEGPSPNDLSRLYDQYDVARRQLASLALGHQGEAEKTDGRNVIATKLKEIERLERALSRESAEFRSKQRQAHSGHREVCLSLPPNSVLVEYVWYSRYEQPPTLRGDESWTPSYTAFVISGGDCSGSPVRVDLGPAEPIDRLVKELRAGLKIGLARMVPVPSVQERAHELAALAFPPALRQLLKGKSRLVIAPDGLLALVPFALLPGDDGHGFLIETRTISYIPSGRDLLAFDRAPPGTTAPRLLAVGNPDFGAMPATKSNRPATRAACTLDETFSFVPLPATGTEVAQIGRHAAGVASSSAVIVSGADATKAHFLAEIANKTVLHLATHAYFAGEKCQGAGTHWANRTLASFGIQSGGAVGEDPLLLSGLALAGANRDPAQGILTALEITTLDLRHVDLVVLSACDTGLGKLNPGQELLGLRWAFAYAGARHLVTSLWQVPDEPTATLMGQFYNHLWQQNLSPVAALREAQLARLRANRAAGDPRPWEWAAFTVSGPAK